MAVNDFNDSFRELVVLLHLLNYTEWFNISLDCQRHRILMHCKKSLSFNVLQSIQMLISKFDINNLRLTRVYIIQMKT